MSLTSKSTADTVRTYANLDEDEWDRFLEFTKIEAQQLLNRYPNHTWGKIPLDERRDLEARVNASLEKERIKRVHRDVIKWRMPHALNGVRASSSKPIIGGNASNLTDAAADAEASTKPPYDPIRDT